MQKAHMRGVQQRLESLQPVAMNDSAARRDVLVRQARELEIGEPRRIGFLLAEIDPQQAAGFVSRMAAHGHARGEALAPRAQLGRSIDALAVDRELPAVKDAPQPALLVPRECEARAAVRTGFLHETDTAVGRAES